MLDACLGNKFGIHIHALGCGNHIPGPVCTHCCSGREHMLIQYTYCNILWMGYVECTQASEEILVFAWRQFALVSVPVHTSSHWDMELLCSIRPCTMSTRTYPIWLESKAWQIRLHRIKANFVFVSSEQFWGFVWNRSHSRCLMGDADIKQNQPFSLLNAILIDNTKYPTHNTCTHLCLALDTHAWWVG